MSAEMQLRRPVGADNAYTPADEAADGINWWHPYGAKWVTISHTDVYIYNVEKGTCSQERQHSMI